MQCRKIEASVFGIILVLSCLISPSYEKRLGGLGRRNKPKNNLSVRRQQGAPSPNPVPAPVPPAKTVSGATAPNTGAKPAGWNDGPSPVGPPPAYPGMGHNPVPGNGAPPAYSQGSFGSPPSYSALLNRDSHIGKIPPRGQHYGSSDHTSFVGLGGHGGPSYTGINGPHVGGYSGVNSGVGGVGMGGVGMGGVGMASGGYGGGYGYGRSSPFSFGNMLTGLALWQVARGFNSYPRERTVHVYDHRNETTEPQPKVDAPYDPTVPQDPYAPFNPVPQYNTDPYNPVDPHNPQEPQYPVGPSDTATPPPAPEFNVYGYGFGYAYGDQNNKSLNIVPLPQSDDSVTASSQSPQSETLPDSS